jgi:hypothetical protein
MRHSFVVISALLIAAPATVLAQESPVNAPTPTISELLPPEQPAEAVTPSGAATSSAPTGYFPSLPPSRPCVKKDLLVMWKLEHVYENPAGVAMATYNAQPFQYIRFLPNSTYRELKDINQPLSKMAVKQQMKAQTGGSLLQYVVSDTGIIYFYRDGVATDTMACFIVANPKEPFMVGEMLLMPPAPEQGQPASRMVKVYNKAFASSDTRTKVRAQRAQRAKRRHR